MKKMSCLAIICLICFSAYSQPLVLKVKINDADTVMALLISIDKTDTAYTTNGRFTFRRNLLSPQLFTIVCVKNAVSIQALREGNERKMRSRSDGVSRELFLESDNVSITTSFAAFGYAKPSWKKTGSQNKYEAFRKRFDPLVRMARTIIDSSYSPGLLAESKNIYQMLYKRINQIEDETAEKFATENSNNIAGAYVLYRYCKINNQDKLDSIYNLFDPQLRASAYLQQTKEKIKALGRLVPGQAVPDFIAAVPGKQKINLADQKGKYIVLDFWGSWCVPCIKGIPKMKEYYSKYQGKIEFIGIACNDKEKEWQDAIAKYDLGWINMRNASKPNDLVAKYNVEAYPTKILIDKNGNFIQRFIGETEEFYAKLDSLVH